MRMVRVHKGCGGRIKDDRCSKCNKVWKGWEKLTEKGIEDVELFFSGRSYRHRIRNGEDLC